MYDHQEADDLQHEARGERELAPAEPGIITKISNMYKSRQP